MLLISINSGILPAACFRFTFTPTLTQFGKKLTFTQEFIQSSVSRRDLKCFTILEAASGADMSLL